MVLDNLVLVRDYLAVKGGPNPAPRQLVSSLWDCEIRTDPQGVHTWLIWRFGGIENKKHRWLCNEHTEQGARGFILVRASGE
jgi:hypothetical protein